MSNQQIGTKLHKARECMHKDGRNHEQLVDFFTVCDGVPNFVFSNELKMLFLEERQTVQLSTLSMFKAGVAKLPYPVMMAEIWGGMADRWFFIIGETDKVNVFDVAGLEYLHDVTDHIHPEERDMLSGDAIVGELLKATLTFVEIGHDGEAEWGINYSDHKDLKREGAVRHAIAALNLALIMSQMGELDREIITPTKLNKARSGSGKISVNSHIIVRIGHVYDKAGNKVKITDANRRTMPIHMRAGHTKHQPHGKQWMDENPIEAAKPGNTDTRHVVWIAPVLVNYIDGSPLPVPKPRVVRL